jgi:pimeloyl-ACP methyl ester carboxylesterase
MTDARGHGLTDPPTAADTADAQVLDLVGFVHAMKFDKPILMGHSMGAATVMRIGAQYPDLARAIIMLDPGLGQAGGRGPAAAPAAAASGCGAQPAPGALVMAGSPEALAAQNIAASRNWWRNAVRICRNGISSTASIGRSRKSIITGHIHHGRDK